MVANAQIPFRASALLLKCVPLLSTLSERQLAMLSQVASRQSYVRDQTIIEAGEVSDSLYIILSGRVQVVLKERRRGDIIVFSLGPGEFFGEMSLIDKQPRSASVIASEACEVLLLKGSDFIVCLNQSPPMASTVMRELVRRLRAADERISSLALMDVYGRVARLLLEMSQEINGQKVVTQRVNRTLIAKMVGASREMVSRVMKDLVSRHRIEVREKSIVLLDGLLDWD